MAWSYATVVPSECSWAVPVQLASVALAASWDSLLLEHQGLHRLNRLEETPLPQYQRPRDNHLRAGPARSHSAAYARAADRMSGSLRSDLQAWEASPEASQTRPKESFAAPRLAPPLLAHVFAFGSATAAALGPPPESARAAMALPDFDAPPRVEGGFGERGQTG